MQKQYQLRRNLMFPCIKKVIYAHGSMNKRITYKNDHDYEREKHKK